MTNVHHTLSPPAVVSDYFEKEYPVHIEYSHDFYWYWKTLRNGLKERIYGCFVRKHGKLYHCSTQASQAWYETQMGSIPF